MWWSFGILFYFLPTIFALRKEGLLPIFLLNFFFGWTVVGWITASFITHLASDRKETFIMKIACKKCHQNYDVPNEAWYGQSLLCSRCDNCIKVPTPWFSGMGIGLDASWLMWFIIFIWVYGTIVYHFSQVLNRLPTNIL